MLQLLEARHHDPFSVLGRHRQGGHDHFVVFNPYAERVTLGATQYAMDSIGDTGLFECTLPKDQIPARYPVQWLSQSGTRHSALDPYCFPPQIAEFDLHLFGEGRHWHIYRILGAHPRSVDHCAGVLFGVWAPNAERVSVVGDFNYWDGRCHPMRVRAGSGIWELFIPGLESGALYKFEIRNRDSGAITRKSDPFGQLFEMRPKTASVVRDSSEYDWQDEVWMEGRKHFDWQHSPVSIYEVHLGSWKRAANGDFLNYRELTDELIEYVSDLGFTHIELLPVSEHPLDASWGYQTTGYYAPTRRHGLPDDFRDFVDRCHQNGIGVILDWTPGHFPKDAHALACFDGSALYEHADPKKGEHPDWGTHVYNYGRNEVRNFLLANAMFWIEEFHIDGLRVDAVASMLYLDYSRKAGEWIPNRYGGNENLEAIDFIRDLNHTVLAQHPGSLMIAEESTSWPQVTRPVWTGGLGFSMKWNMGWMHDVLDYMSHDPVYRHFHHDRLTFGLLYAFTENFVLPFSHDEVVYGKRSMLYKMPGDEWQRFANLRLLYTFLFTYPGKKLLFMGCEFGQGNEWNFDTALDWTVLDYPFHRRIQSLVRDLNRLYRYSKALHGYDFEHQGFVWIDCHDASQSVLTYSRTDTQSCMIVVLNFTPVPRLNYRIGVPESGIYCEILNSDSRYYGGSNLGNGYAESEALPWMNQPHSLNLTLPPLGGIILSRIDADRPLDLAPG
ncbi:MAG: 1,4-alpha-glucan branching protein GlgB [Methylococcales bacterium]